MSAMGRFESASLFANDVSSCSESRRAFLVGAARIAAVVLAAGATTSVGASALSAQPLAEPALTPSEVQTTQSAATNVAMSFDSYKAVRRPAKPGATAPMKSWRP